VRFEIPHSPRPVTGILFLYQQFPVNPVELSALLKVSILALRRSALTVAVVGVVIVVVIPVVIFTYTYTLRVSFSL
jgi:hypothetical protein